MEVTKRVAAIAVAGALIPAGVAAGEIDPQLATLLEAAAPRDPIPVIVTLRDQVNLDRFEGQSRPERRRNVVRTLRRHAEASQAPVRTAMRTGGAVAIQSLWVVNSVAATLPARRIRSLAQREDVAEIRLDAELTAPPDATGTAPASWNLTAVRADGLWALGFDGDGAVIASLDTGVDALHPDLENRWRGGDNSWYDPYRQHFTPYDAHGHGTQTMGVMVGGSAGGTAIGMAPGAQWIAAKIFDDYGRARLSAIHLAFQWLLDPDGDPDVDDAPDVVAAAWGQLNNTGGCDFEFQPDIQVLRAADIAVAFSAGNTGPDPQTSVSPANYPESYAVGAVDENLLLADFSARGPSACDGALFPDIVAPGVNVRTSDLTYGGIFPGSYTSVSGTSFSVAHVAGAMALLRAAVPEADVASLESALNQGVVDVGPAGPDNGSGWGLLDVVSSYEHLAAVVETPGDTGDNTNTGDDTGTGDTEEPPAGDGDGTATTTDADGDGVAAADDCNDGDSTVHPGADEVKYDGIDQDCNGYDLTIAIDRAVYSGRRDQLDVIATSELGADAELRLDGHGPMNWNATYGFWETSVRDAGGDPGSVTVAGIEGRETAPTQSR